MAKKKQATGNIDARLVALRADIQALQGDMKGLYGDVSEIASERAALAMRSAEEIADQMRARFHPEDRLMLWFDFNNHDSSDVCRSMRSFMEKVRPKVSL